MRGRLAASIGFLVLGLGAAAGIALRNSSDHAPGSVGADEARRGIGAAWQRLRHVGDEEVDGAACDPNSLDRGLVMPTGKPTEMACDDARTVVQQARTSLAGPATPIDAAKFASATSDWLDPHGLWSVAPDAPIGPLVQRNAERLLAELEAALARKSPPGGV